MSEQETAKDRPRDFVSKSIATIIIANLAVIILVGLSVAANAMINSEELLFVVVGFMTYAAFAVALVSTGYGLLKMWSQP